MASSTSVPELSSEAVLLQTGKILESDLFREAPVQKKLLNYLVEQSLAGNAENLKEYVLGTVVFQRGDRFDPRTDSIVRVQIGVLRKKLAAYYAGPGARDSVLIEVPRGHYCPHFSAFTPAPEATPEAPADIRENPSARLRIEGGWQPWVYVAAGLVAGALLASAVLLMNTPKANAAKSSATASEWRDHPVWKGFFEPGVTTKLVVGTPLMYRFHELLVRDTEVNTPEEFARSSRLRSLGASSKTPGEAIEVYTGLGEAAGIQSLERFFWASSSDLPLLRNRLARWQDVTSGNVIFLSSFRFRTLKQELDLPSDFEFDPKSGNLKNLKPGTGEPSEYKPLVSDGRGGTDYAVVSVWPSTLPGRRIVMIGGAYTWGTQGAAEYITDGPSLRELRSKLTPAPSPDSALQLVIKVEVKDAQPIAAASVAHHWLPAKTGGASSR